MSCAYKLLAIEYTGVCSQIRTQTDGPDKASAAGQMLYHGR
jgi:hypothetical protein